MKGRVVASDNGYRIAIAVYLEEPIPTEGLQVEISTTIRQVTPRQALHLAQELIALAMQRMHRDEMERQGEGRSLFG